MRKRCIMALAGIAILSLATPVRAEQARSIDGEKDAFQYIRGKLLLLPRQGPPGMASIAFEPTTCVLTANYNDGSSIENPLGSLDTNAMRWAVYDVSKDEKVLSLDVLNKPEGAQMVVIDRGGSRTHRPFARFQFSLAGASAVPNFQTDFERALKRLIVLCGGSPTIHIPE